MATRTGYRNTIVVASPDGMYLYASNRQRLLAVKSSPRMTSLMACLPDTRKFYLRMTSHSPSSITARKYLKKRMLSTFTPFFIKGTAKRGLSPYVTPVIIPAAYPAIWLFFIC